MGIRHKVCRVQNRLENVSGALRKRNYHVEWNGEYRMGRLFCSNELVRCKEGSFRVEQAANQLWTLLLRLPQRAMALYAHDLGTSPRTAGILAASDSPVGSLWKSRNWLSSFTTTSCG